MQSSPSRQIRLLIALATGIAAVAGCTSPAPSTSSPTTVGAPAFSNWPASLNDLRFHWYAAPGIDLETGPAVPLRAYVESYDLVDFTDGDMSAAYPGFLRATPKNGPRDTLGFPIELGSIRPQTRDEQSNGESPSAVENLFGSAPFYVSSLEPTGDGYRAFVCASEYSVFRRDPKDSAKYRSIIGRSDAGEPPNKDRYGIIVWRVELTDKDSRVAPDHPASPSTPQQGPAPAPSKDVFGPWFVTAASFTLWGDMGQAQDVGPPELQQQCADNMPDDAAARKAMYTGAHDQPPPHGDPIPGWPAN
jgi:hypothetical protein